MSITELVESRHTINENKNKNKSEERRDTTLHGSVVVL